MKNIIFVSNGNIGRSIMAHGLFNKIIKEESKEKEFKIDSCGVFAYTGQEPIKEVSIVMEKENINMKEYKSKSVNNCKIENADLILCMTNIQKLQMQHRYPEKKNKVYTLKEYIIFDNENNIDINIEEPSEAIISNYEECYKEINKCLHKLIKIVE